VAFGWQIYFDFSGYTDMAPRHRRDHGLPADAELQQSYTAPAWATSEPLAHQPVDLVKDYLYFPWGQPRQQVANLIATCSSPWLVFRRLAWAEWGFIIWGALHALGRCLTREVEQDGVPIKSLAAAAGRSSSWSSPFVTFTWILLSGPDAG